jgi:ATP-dependent Clp protease ATP-binding subunit ClpB
LLPIQSGIENPLAKAILESRFAAKDTIRLDHKMGGFTFEKSMVTAA